MAVTLDNTLSGTLANSYVDVAYCDTYWANHWNSQSAGQWAALTALQKPQLLVQSCRVIEGLRFTNFVPINEYDLHYDRISGTVTDITLTREPVKYYYYQRLQFPRNLDLNPNAAPGQAFYIPETVMMAQCEQAVYLLNFDESAIANKVQGIVNNTVSLGRSQIHLNQEYSGKGSFISPTALYMVQEFLVHGSRLRRS